MIVQYSYIKNLRTYLVIGILAGIIIGIAIGQFFYFTDLLILIWILVGLLAIILIFYKYNIYIPIIAILVISIILGIFRFGTIKTKSDNDISLYADSTISFSGTIVDDPVIDNNLIKFTVAVTDLIDSNQSVDGKILVTTRKFPNFYYGNKILVNGIVNIPYDSADFKYSNYLSRFGVYSVIRYPEIEVIQEFQGNFILSFLYDVKHLLVSTINKILPEPMAAFLVGLLFGVKQNIPEDLLTDFSTTGLTHIIALSGFNITIIAGALMVWMKRLPIKLRINFTIITIIAFVLLTGASPSVIRAAIMGILILLATFLGRTSDITISLLLTAVVMISLNPKILFFDVGFQLSFLATVGIIYLHPLLYQVLPKWLFIVREFLSPTLAALFWVLPIIVFNFNSLSIIAPIANVLVLPLVPISMGLGFGALVIGLININLGIFSGLIAWVPLKIIIFITQFLADMPFAALNVSISKWTISIYYLMLIILMVYLYIKNVVKKQATYLGSSA